MRALLALGVLLTVLAAGCGGAEDITQRFARAAIESHLAGDRAYDLEHVQCTGNPRPWFVEQQTTESICAVRRTTGGCDWFHVELSRSALASPRGSRSARRTRAAAPPDASRRRGKDDAVPSGGEGYPRPVPLSTGQRLLRFDRRLETRFVAGADEAGRGSLAGPLVVAGVLFDYASLRDGRVRPLARLNDSKQVDPDEREGFTTRCWPRRHGSPSA